MAKKRMFSLDIIDTDLFQEMPQTSRLLYYELCMRADDDGFVGSPKKIQRMVGCSEDDFKVLISKQFIIPFDTGIVVIKHWKIHNYIQKDRYKETIYIGEKSQLYQEENGMYTKCIQDVNKMDTQNSIDKNSIDKNSIADLVKKDEIAEITKCYEENIGMFTPATAEKLFSYLDDIDYLLIIEAIKLSAIRNKRTTAYISGILNAWQRNGYKVLADIQEEQQKEKREETHEEMIARKLKSLEGGLYD